MNFVPPSLSNYFTLSYIEGYHHQNMNDNASVANCLMSLMVIFSMVEVTILVLFALNSWLPQYLRQRFWWDEECEEDDWEREGEEERNDRIQESLQEYTWKLDFTSKCQECSICLQNFQANDIVVSSTIQPCGHIFHRKCLHPWLTDHSTCPCCRQEMLKPPDIQTKEDPLAVDEIDENSRISIVPWMTETGELPMNFRDYCLFFF